VEEAADQVDVSAGSFERERSFWAALTGWRGRMEPVRRNRCGWSYGGPARLYRLTGG
jgi:hypothetical protein